MEQGAWWKFFHKLGNPVFTDELCAAADQRYLALHDSFLEHYVAPAKGPLLALGVGYGLVEIPMARRGYRIIGLDNDQGVLDILRQNARYADGRVTAVYGDLRANFHNQYLDKNIQACISFGLLEHFPIDQLKALVNRQFTISPLLLCDIPVRTSATLKTFKAVDQPVGHVDDFGIYRNFWTPEYWKSTVFKENAIIAERLHSEFRADGQIDALTLVVKRESV